VNVTDRIVLRPTPRAPATDGEETQWYRPDACFGSGSHPTTRLAAARVQAACLAKSGLTVLDVGSGTGVLCFVAARSGAKHCFGIDIDPLAVQNARENAELNALSGPCEFSDEPLESLGPTFDLVVANIDEPTLLALAPALATRLTPNGELFVTGVLGEQEAAVRAAFAQAALRVTGRDELGEWVLLALSR
jgi:ribosomal protein L11 methyltransferase